MVHNFRPIEDALDALLRATMEHEKDKRSRVVTESPRAIRATPFVFREPTSIPTRDDNRTDWIASDPVYGALGLAVRWLGERIFKMTGSVDAMRDVAHRVAARDPSHNGRRLSILNHRWDWIGNDKDRWLA